MRFSTSKSKLLLSKLVGLLNPKSYLQLEISNMRLFLSSGQVLVLMEVCNPIIHASLLKDMNIFIEYSDGKKLYIEVSSISAIYVDPLLPK